jgi:hypothetical protein
LAGAEALEVKRPLFSEVDIGMVLDKTEALED